MKPNPYESPASLKEEPALSVEQSSRAGLAEVIRQYLHEEITAFQLDERLEVHRDSPDPTISFVADSMWFHYDDSKDHLVSLAKSEWDHIQRLLLLLESPTTVELYPSWKWSATQAVAVAALAMFCWFLPQLSDDMWILLAIPFGFVSMGIAWLRRDRGVERPYQAITYPFESFRDLRSACDAGEFRKERYPRHLSRRIRSPMVEWACALNFYVCWLLFSPFALLLQALPCWETVSLVRVGGVRVVR